VARQRPKITRFRAREGAVICNYCGAVLHVRLTIDEYLRFWVKRKCEYCNGDWNKFEEYD